jgi:hypothetical protein
VFTLNYSSDFLGGFLARPGNIKRADILNGKAQLGKMLYVNLWVDLRGRGIYIRDAKLLRTQLKLLIQ